jgi:hypothetical protein
MAETSVEYDRRVREIAAEERKRQDERRRKRLLAVAVAEGRIMTRSGRSTRSSLASNRDILSL